MAPAPGLSILNVGFGLGIVDRMFQATQPRAHVIIEAHPQVLQHMRDTGVYDWPNVTVLEGRWQDYAEGDGLTKLLEAAQGGFDAIFVDTFAEGYEGESGPLSPQCHIQNTTLSILFRSLVTCNDELTCRPEGILRAPARHSRARRRVLLLERPRRDE